MTDTAIPSDPIAHFASVSPHALAVWDLDQSQKFSYAELDELISRATFLLRALLGEPAGERVAVIARNRAEMLILHFACIRSGAIFVPINWRLAASEVQHVVSDCNPGLAFVEREFRPALDGLDIHTIELDTDSHTQEHGLLIRLRMLPDPDQPSRKQFVPAETPVTLLYSSGTTGRPKGVIVTLMNALCGAMNLGLDMHCTAACVFLCDMPLFHTAGLFAAARIPLCFGGRLILSRKFDAPLTYQRLSDPQLGITHYFAVTQMAMALRQLPDFNGRHLSHLTAFITGGAPNPAAHVRRWLDEGVRMINAWGMSEIGSGTAQPMDWDHLRSNPSAIGLPHFTIELQLLDTQGRPVAEGQAGEICVRGPNVTPGYWRRPDLNNLAFRDGWFHTGDLAVRDAAGCYSLIDRIKDMFISGGENIYPAEIEAVMVEMPEVADAAVVGVPDEKWGEAGVAFVVCIAGVTLERSVLQGHCARRLARFKVPRHFEFVTQLPKTASGKVRKDLLRAQWAARN
jgi:fatty-acyl-CoA synthase